MVIHYYLLWLFIIIYYGYLLSLSGFAQPYLASVLIQIHIITLQKFYTSCLP